MSWIKTIPPAEASGRLQKTYDRLAGPGGQIDNILTIHSLRPHTLEGHMGLYKAVLHHSGNGLPKAFLETLGVWVSLLNACDYCARHHFAGLQRLMNNDPAANQILQSLEAGTVDALAFDAPLQAALTYARKLTQTPGEMTAQDVADLRDVGFGDGEILEINQVCAYFAYANRTVLGLGCSTEGEALGLSPNDSDNSENWSHT